jgi:ABC-type nitrate/sulfonate/bicarbonate transport system substrate-binding protein
MVFHSTEQHKRKEGAMRAIVFLIVFGLQSFLTTEQIAAAPIKVKVSYLTNEALYSVLFVTKEAAIFEKNGLEVEPVYIPPTLLTVAMLAGEAPIGFSGAGTPIEASLRGADFVSIASLVTTGGPVFLLTRKEITNADQLKKKKLGISRFGATPDIVLRAALRLLRIDAEKDVTVLQIGNTATRVAALKAGTIDGTLVTVEQAFVAKQQGLNVLVDVRKLGVEYPLANIITTKKFVVENEDMLRKFVRSIVQGIYFYKTNRDVSLKVMRKYMRVDDQRILEVGYEDTREALLAKPYPSVKGIEAVLEEVSSRIPAAKKAKPEQFYDAKFIKELDESRFIDNLYR